MENKIELSLMEYNRLVIQHIRYELMVNAIKHSIHKYVKGNGLYLNSEFLDLFALICPKDYKERKEVLMKEGDPE